MPSGLSDSKLYRTLTLHGERALVKVIERIFPQDKQAQKRARTALRNYLAQQGNFDVRKLASWWDDGAHDEIRGLPKRRVSIAQLWTSRELDCPELAHVMQRLAGESSGQANLINQQLYNQAISLRHGAGAKCVGASERPHQVHGRQPVAQQPFLCGPCGHRGDCRQIQEGRRPCPQQEDAGDLEVLRQSQT